MIFNLIKKSLFPYILYDYNNFNLLVTYSKIDRQIDNNCFIKQPQYQSK